MNAVRQLFIQGKTKVFPYKEVFLNLIPARMIGAYLLFNEGKVIYCGRSDTDLRRRLRYHNYRPAATHFTFYPCRTPILSYLLEKRLYQRHLPALNFNYPAYPGGYGQQDTTILLPLFKKN
ncbi:GIY-YIG nuclease family protein [Mucilaginibacter jinjuensis]|uniref:GIY-YIG nuclease family protein n=1 Tax=Mucilaginibacter jinjuensis TaxID=1176721 RepID=A0ABY7TAX9_9SPHI|nr:GIY-YIG nuclease family protein [Mucilaginibacter jinjuensis]WCT13473.1 GIY-YIG nuclease family protein [Mucilaginibacter jinjuensis]